MMQHGNTSLCILQIALFIPKDAKKARIKLEMKLVLFNYTDTHGN
jgi:hypothetical protein